MILPENESYHVHLGDAIEHMPTLPAHCMDASVYSPPFPSVYSYTSLSEDIGNSEEESDYRLHFSYFFRQMVRVMKPGRVMVVHCTQILRMKRSGGQGTYDFRGLLIRLAVRAGFIYDYDWNIRKPPQQQAIRTKSRSLQFSGLESNRLQSRGAIPDFLIKFWAPGVAKVPVDSEGEVSRNQWIAWAEGCWDDISVSDTLNTAEAKSPEDVRHICPLQLETIRRLVRLYSNPGEIVFSPFAGIGSELYEAIKIGRRGYGCEIKPEYHAAALVNCKRAIAMRDESTRTLFDGLDNDAVAVASDALEADPDA